MPCLKKNQWRLVGFVIEEAGLTEHGNNNTIYIFFNICIYSMFPEWFTRTKKKFPFIYILYIHFKIKLNVLTYLLITF
jgi:hypothetical protein